MKNHSTKLQQAPVQEATHNGQYLSDWIDNWQPEKGSRKRDEKIKVIAEAVGLRRESVYRWLRDGVAYENVLLLRAIGITDMPFNHEEQRQPIAPISTNNVNTNTNTVGQNTMKVATSDNKIVELENRIKAVESELQFVKAMMTKLS